MVEVPNLFESRHPKVISKTLEAPYVAVYRLFTLIYIL